MQLSVADRAGSVIIDEVDRPVRSLARLELSGYLAGNLERTLAFGAALDREPLLQSLGRVLVPLAPSIPLVENAGARGRRGRRGDLLHPTRAPKTTRLPPKPPRPRGVFARSRHHFDAARSKHRAQVVSTIRSLETVGGRSRRILRARELNRDRLPPGFVRSHLADVGRKRLAGHHRLHGGR